jgi:hypothetical protein
MACVELIWVHGSGPARENKLLFLQVNIEYREPAFWPLPKLRNRIHVIVGVAR